MTPNDYNISYKKNVLLFSARNVVSNPISRKFLTRAGEKVPDHCSFIVAVSLLVILLTSVVCCFGKRC